MLNLINFLLNTGYLKIIILIFIIFREPSNLKSLQNSITRPNQKDYRKERERFCKFITCQQGRKKSEKRGAKK